MKTLYLDCFSGISGDMFLGLLIDLGVDPAALERELAKLRLPGWSLKIDREQRHGIEGCRVRVICEEQHHHRHWSDIDRLLADSSLGSGVQERARRIFFRLGEAEAKVHGIPLEQVHFHEVGAIDAIVDLCGAAIGLELLGIEQLICSPLPLSRGLSRCAHGALPLPAPAVVELLTGTPIVDSGSDRELVTPSGAAIAREATEFGPMPAIRIERSGYGVGGWQLDDRPNLLRGIIGSSAARNLQRDRVAVLETHIDDGNPEWLGALLEDLMAAGALDATYSPLQMKKNRPAARLTVIAEEDQAEKLAHLIMTGSSASGVRRTLAERFKLERKELEVATEFGPAAAKLFFDNGELLRIAPEFESCRLLAKSSGLPLPEIYRRVEERVRQSLTSAAADRRKR
jgi:uncharacterized protein (TIGR00299 family) protein